MLLGATLFGYIADRRGRRLSFLCSLSLTIFSGLLASLAQNGMQMICIQGLLGTGIGGAHVAYSMFTEFLPKVTVCCTAVMCRRTVAEHRYYWTTSGRVAYCTRQVSDVWWRHHDAGNAFVVLYFMEMSWRIFLLTSVLPLLILILFAHNMPETPRYLLVQGRDSEAKAVLLRMATENKTKSLLVNDLSDWISSAKIIPNRGAAQSKPPSYRDLVAPTIRRSTCSLFVLWWTVILSYYGLVLYTPEVLGGADGLSSRAFVSLII